MIQKSIVVILLSLQGLLVGWISWGTCPNKTEVGHMAATVYSWHTHRFDVFHVNPPLSRMVTGMPVVLCGPEYDWSHYSSSPQDRVEWAMGDAFIAANTPETTRWCFALARWSLIPLLLLGGYFGFRLSSELYGEASALLFLSLWCFSPLLMSWGATICPDVLAGALGVVAIYTFRCWLKDPKWTRAATAGVCLGLLLLTKLTWIIALGLWPVIWCLWTMPNWLKRADRCSQRRPLVRQLAAILVISLYTLNMGYLFDGTCRPLGEYVFVSQLAHGQEFTEYQKWSPALGNRFAGSWLGKIPVPLPGDFVQGIDTQRHDFERGLPSYLQGQWADHGWWYYYLYALSVKTPLGTLWLTAMAVGVTTLARGFNAPWRDEMIVLVPGLAILVFVSSQTGFSMHSRYVIPALPFFFLWISKVARVFEMWPLSQKGRAMAAMVVVALTSSVGSGLWAYPHNLSYFNELVGGPSSGGEHLLGSNTDWSQDLLYLKGWIDKHADVTLDGLAFYGSYPATLAGIPETPPPPSGFDDAESGASIDDLGPRPGWYALSVNHLYRRDGRYRYFLEHFEPVAMAGYSIYIYDVTMNEANRVRCHMGLPELPGDWQRE